MFFLLSTFSTNVRIVTLFLFLLLFTLATSSTFGIFNISTIKVFGIFGTDGNCALISAFLLRVRIRSQNEKGIFASKKKSDPFSAYQRQFQRSAELLRCSLGSLPVF